MAAYNGDTYIGQVKSTLHKDFSFQVILCNCRAFDIDGVKAEMYDSLFYGYGSTIKILEVKKTTKNALRNATQLTKRLPSGWDMPIENVYIK